MGDFRTGNGADWLDFLATRLGRYRREQTEMLPDPETLHRWLTERGLEPIAAVTGADLEAARSLREGLHHLATAAVRGLPPAAADVRMLQDALSVDTPLRVRRVGVTVHVNRPADVPAALARLARQAATDLTGPTRERLHACGDESCSGVFIDQTGRRRWCSDERCGVRARVRAHRARARADG